MTNELLSRLAFRVCPPLSLSNTVAGASLGRAPATIQRHSGPVANAFTKRMRGSSDKDCFSPGRVRWSIEILDRDPPVAGGQVIPAGFGNGNTFPQVYDALGRYLFAGVTIDF